MITQPDVITKPNIYVKNSFLVYKKIMHRTYTYAGIFFL